MIKKTRFIELKNLIKKTIVSYISILIFIMLSVALFTGIGWGAIAFSDSLNTAFEECQLHDYEVTFPYGLSEDDLNELEATEVIDAAEGIYTCDYYFMNGDKKVQAKVRSCPEKLDMFMDVTGKLPENNNEIAVAGYWAKENNVHIGDTITFIPKNNAANAALINTVLKKDLNAFAKLENTEGDFLKNESFKVTALVHSSAYTSIYTICNGVSADTGMQVDCVMFVPKKAFNENAYCDYATVLLHSPKLRNVSFVDSEYETESEKTQRLFINKLNEIADAKNARVTNAASEMIEQSEKQIENARTAIANAKKQIVTGKSQIAQGEKKISASKKGLAAEKEALKKGEAQISEISEQIDILKEKISQTHDQQELAFLQHVLAEAESAKSELAERVYSLRQKYNQDCTRLDNAKAALADGKQKVKDSENLLSQAEEDEEQAEEEQKTLKKELSNLQSYDVTIQNRTDNPSAWSILSVVGSFMNFRYSTVILFILVGLMVCYSVVSRLVYEERKLIGVKKALGFTNKEITVFYLLYAGSVAVAGAISGILVGRFIIEPVLLNVMSDNYVITETVYHISFPEAAVCLAAATAAALATCWLACRKTSHQNVSALLSGAGDISAKARWYEKKRFWLKISAFTKAIINNSVNDKRRTFATIVGIMACTALIVCGLTMKNNVEGSFDKHSKDVQHFDTIIYYDNKVEGCEEKIQNLLDEKEMDYGKAYFGVSALKSPDGKVMPAYMLVPDSNTDLTLFDLYDENHKKTVFDDGVYMSMAYGKHNNATSGDILNYIDQEGHEHELKIKGFYEYYLTQHHILMNERTYKRYFGNDAAFNAIMVRTNGLSPDVIANRLSEIEGFRNLEDYYHGTQFVYNAMSTAAIITVTLYFVLSVILALFVLLNLLTMFVQQKKTEIITLMINGYSLNKARKYIYLETIVFGLFGIAAGTVLGAYAGMSAVTSLSTDVSCFMQDISIPVCLTGAAISSIIIFSVSLMAISKIKKFRLSDLNR